MRIARVLATVFMVGVLSACSAPGPAPSATPTQTAASEAEVAGVIAGHVSDWREVIANAGACRELWASSADAVDLLNGYACFLKERTIGLTASNVLRDWGGMQVPESMKYDVDDLSSVLTVLAEPDITDVCGEDVRPSRDAECTRALGNRAAFYTLLGTKLDRWEKYL